MYLMYIGIVLCPVTPEKIQIKTSSQNKSMSLINGGEINIPKDPALSEMSFELLLPNLQYPFAVYKSKFQKADVYLKQIRVWKEYKQPVHIMIVREMPDGKLIYHTTDWMTLESYTITESAEDGFDVRAALSFKQHRSYGTKTYSISGGKAAASASRDSTNSPAPVNQNKTYTVQSGDTLWGIAKKFYGDGSEYTKIADANKDKVSDPNLIYPGQLLTIPV